MKLPEALKCFLEKRSVLFTDTWWPKGKRSINLQPGMNCFLISAHGAKLFKFMGQFCLSGCPNGGQDVYLFLHIFRWCLSVLGIWDNNEQNVGEERRSRVTLNKRRDWATTPSLPLCPDDDIERELMTLAIANPCLAAGQNTRWRFSLFPCSQAQFAVPVFSKMLLILKTK